MPLPTLKNPPNEHTSVCAKIVFHNCRCCELYLLGWVAGRDSKVYAVDTRSGKAGLEVIDIMEFIELNDDLDIDESFKPMPLKRLFFSIHPEYH